MRKLSYKTLLIIFFFLLIAVIILLKFVLPKNKVEASWWNDNWSYRKAISIVNNTNFDATNIPYKIDIDTQTLITNGKLQADADDIRIVDSNGQIVRSQVEKNTLNTANTKIWFEATVKSNSTSSYYLYYGNSSTAAPVFESDISTLTPISNSATIEMKDGFSYTISNANGGKINTIKKNNSSLGIGGNIINSSSYPGSWWSSSALTQTVLNSNGPLFAEINYGAGTTGSYSAYGTNHKIFSNGFVETQISITYNTSGSENFYYYLSFNTGTRNSVWVNGSGTLVDQDADSGNLTEASLGQNWFGQRWTSTDNYGGTIITKNGSDWTNGGTSTRASYYQTNYSYSQSFTNGSSREVRFGVFAGDGGLTEMQQKGANYGGLTSSLSSEELSPAPIAYWKFDEGTGTAAYDSSPNQNNGTISSATWQTENQCISGKCLNFDSSQNQYVLSNSTIPLTSSQTYSVWVYPKSSDSLMGILTTHNHSNTSNLGINISTSKFSISIGYIDGSREYQDRQSNFTVPLNTWTHVELVFNAISNTIAFYVNGKFDSQWTLTKTVKFVPNKILVGQWSTAYLSGYKFNGLIDEPKVYPYARTADQIKLDYNSRGSSKGSTVNLGVKSSSAPDLKSKLVAYYKFDEGSGTTANNSGTGGSTLNGILENGPTWNNDSKFNKGLSLDGLNDYIQISNNSTTKYLGGDLSMSVWIKLDPSDDGGRIISKPWNGNGQYNYWITSSGGSNPVLTFGMSGASSFSLSFNSTFTTNQWHYLSFSVNGTTKFVQLFIDGKLINSSTHAITDWTPSAGDSSLPLAFGTFYPYGGSWSGITSHATKGFIDEIKIYNAALTTDEIKQDYNQGSAISFGSTNQTIGGTTTSLEYCIPGDTSFCASPIAEYNFEENTGTTTKDTSGNNNNFTFNAGTSAPAWAIGKKNFGSSLSFNGSSNWLQRTLSPSIPANTDYTQCLWFNPSTNAARQVMIDDANQFEHWIALNTNKTIVGCYYNTVEICTTSTTTINLNTWNYVCLSVQSGQKMSLFLNGSLTSENTNIGSSLPKIYDDVCLGSAGSSAHNEKFNGKIDDVRIYDYARTPAQIAYDYNKGGPLAWLKLDECQGSTVNDSSGIGYSGSIHIGPSGPQNTLGTCQIGTSAAWTNGASGKINGSLNFDGTDDYLASKILPTVDSFTLGLWFKPGSTITDGQRLYWGAGTNRAILAYSGTLGKLQWYVATSGGNLGYRTTTNKFNLDAWNHVVLVYDGSSVKCYINSVLDPVTGSLSGTSNASAFYFGTNYIATGNWFDGQMDDIRFYNYPLTADQIKTVYNGGAVNFN